MRIFPPLLVTALLLVPARPGFAQGAPKAGPPASSAAPVPSVPPPAGAGASASHEIMTEVDAAMSEKAVNLFKEGNAFFKDGKYAKAHASYKAAWALDLRSARVVRNLGSAELELKMYRDAAEHLLIALRLTEASDPKRSSIEKDVGEARSKVGAVVVKVTGAGQPLDGVEVVHMETGRAYQTPLVDPIFVDAGKVGFRVRREGYESQEKVVDLKPGQEVAVDVALARAPGFDGKTGPAAPSGTAPVPVAGERSKLPGFILGGVGVAAAIAGGALIGVAEGISSDIDTNVPRLPNGDSACAPDALPGENAQCADFRSKADSGSAMGNAGIGLLIGGGALVAGAAIYLLIPAKKASASNSRVIPVVGQNGGGFVLTGSF